MANKTIDRRKAIAAGSQSARVGTKGASSDATRSATREEEQTGQKAGGVELLEESDELTEAEEAGAEEEDEEEEAEAEDEDELAGEDEAEEEEEEEEEDEEESRALEKAEDRRVAKRDKKVPAVHPQDYAAPRSGKSRLPNNALIRFARSSYRELSMVTWPTRQETWSWSLVVVGVSAFVAILLGAADLGLSKFVEWWISLAH